MSLFDIRLQRRARFFGTPAAARCASLQPQVELLEDRVCLSVAAPTGLQLAALSSTQVKLTWTNPAGSFGTRVYTWNGAATTLVAQLAKGVTTYTAFNLKPNQTQWFTVEAFDNATRARSPWVAVMTPPDAITAPTNLRVVGTTRTQVNLAWTNSIGVIGYRIYGWDGTRANLLGTTTPSVPAFTVSNLTPGTTYYFHVQAYNLTNSVSTDWISAATTATSITAPTNMQASVLGASTIALSWNDSTGETGYKIYRWDGNASHAASVIATLAANTTGYQSVGLLPGVRYWYYVQALNATASANSAWVNAQTAAAVPLQPPTQLVVQINGTSSVLLSWTEPARAVGYRVFVWSGSNWNPRSIVPAGTNQIQVTGLTVGRTNWLLVQSFTASYAEVANSSAVFVNL